MMLGWNVASRSVPQLLQNGSGGVQQKPRRQQRQTWRQPTASWDAKEARVVFGCQWMTTKEVPWVAMSKIQRMASSPSHDLPPS
mmetsp:Transcript_50544/g.145732  ORF Transcript_50544/g.145732 Transcript_50544/m.145732 type:complete len:84 (-) Transcript_50544:8-259(-)